MTFEFCAEGRCYIVHTETGNGLTNVVLEELDAAEPAALEPSEEA